MSWGAPIWIYLWMAGMAGGGYLATFVSERFSGESNGRLLRLATYLGIPLAAVGVILLIVDLGTPIWFWHLFTQFKVGSPMSMGTWILLVWVILAVVMVMLWWIRLRVGEGLAKMLGQLTSLIGWVNVIFAILLITYTGVLLSVSSQSLWAGTVMLPTLFVASAVSTGVAIVVLAAIAVNSIRNRGVVELQLVLDWLFGTKEWTIPNKWIMRLAEADAIVIVMELAALIGYVIWTAVSTMAGAGEALRQLTVGNAALAVPFWLGVVLLALLIPLFLDIRNRGKDIETKTGWRTIVTSSTCVVLGGLVLRAIMTIGGQL
jgi:formate-dependent nitrite reductase membrane component NrfD